MRLSKFFLNGLALSLSTCSFAGATSPQLSKALEDLSTISNDIKSATTSIDLYQQGLLLSILPGKKLYDVWNGVKRATTSLTDDIDLSPEDSTELLAKVEDMEPLVRKGMESSGAKFSALDEAGIGFVSLALHEGVKRDLKKYLWALRSKLTENEQSRVEDLWAMFLEVHNSNFGE